MQSFSGKSHQRTKRYRFISLGLLCALVVGYFSLKTTVRQRNLEQVQQGISDGKYYAFHQAHRWNREGLLTEQERTILHESAVKYVNENHPQDLRRVRPDDRYRYWIVEWKYLFMGQKYAPLGTYRRRKGPLPIRPVSGLTGAFSHWPFDFRITFPYQDNTPEEDLAVMRKMWNWEPDASE